MFTGHTDWITGIVFTPDGKHVLTSSNDQTARLWDVQTLLEVRQLSGPSGRVFDVAISADGTSLLTAGEDGTTRHWQIDYQDAVELACTQLHRDFTDEERTFYTITGSASTCQSR
jgi:WD40 repeat protein